ncbi:MAG: hypothetical protein QXD08_05400 [Pyrobaculum sp.]
MYPLKYELKAVSLGFRKIAIPAGVALPQNYGELLKKWGYVYELGYMMPLDLTTCLPPKGYLIEVRAGVPGDEFYRVSRVIDEILDDVYAASEESWDESLCVKYLTTEALHAVEIYHRYRGGVLGYPPCCVEAYVSGFIEALRAMLTNSKFSIRKLTRLTTALELAESRAVLEALSSPRRAAEGELPPELYALPYDNFYPHRLDCPMATRIGRELEQALSREERREFRLALVARGLLILTQLWQSYKKSGQKAPELALLEAYAPRLLSNVEFLKEMYPSL